MLDCNKTASVQERIDLMNIVIMSGNLGKDPELRYSTGAKQTAVCRFSIAVNQGYGERKKTIWLNIVTFNKLAENCGKFLQKGRKVTVVGELDIREYEKQDGSKGTITEIVARDVEFSPMNEGQPQNTQTSWSQPQAENWNQKQAMPSWSQPTQTAPQADQQMTYSQYQQVKAQEVPEGFQAMPMDDCPF